MSSYSPPESSPGEIAQLHRRIHDLQTQTAIVEQMGEGAVTITSTGVLHYVNQRFAVMVDRPVARLLGCPLAALMPSSQHEALERLRQVSPGRTERAQLELFRSNGSTIEILASVSGLRTAGCQTHCLIATDLSGIRQVETALSSSDHRCHLMAENVSAFIVECEQNGRVCAVTPSVQSVLGWTPIALIGSEIGALVHPEDGFSLPSSPLGEQPLVRLRGKDGIHRWMRSLSWPLEGEGRRPCRWITSFHDVDELVRLRQISGRGHDRLAVSPPAVSRHPGLPDQDPLLADPTSDVIIHSIGGSVRWGSASLYPMLGWLPEQWLGRSLSELVHPEDLEFFQYFLSRLEAEREPEQLFRINKKQGGYRWFRLSARRSRSAAALQDGEILTFRMVDSGQLIERELQRRARTDAVTGLANRSEVLKHLSHLHHPGRRRDMPLTLIILQLSNFLAMRHTHGKRTADRLLQTAAARLRHRARCGDLLARFGKDELLVVVSDMGNLDQAVRMAERICAELTSPVTIGGVAIHLELRAGVSMETPGDSIEDLLVRAFHAGAQFLVRSSPEKQRELPHAHARSSGSRAVSSGGS